MKKLIKRMLAGLLGLCLLPGVLPVHWSNAMAYEDLGYGVYKTASLTLHYDVLDGKVTITGGGASDGHLVIPDTIDGYPVTQIGEHAFSGCSNITDVTIPNSVAVIGDHAFCYCTGLSVVVIPEGVAQIRGQAFYGCSGLTKVMIAGSVTQIGELAFAGCDMSRDVYFWGDAPAFTYRPFHDVPIDYIMFDTNIHYPANANGWTDDVKANCDIRLRWIAYNVNGNLIYETVDDIWGMEPSYAKITGWIGTPTELVIPEKIGHAAVTEISACAFEGCSSLTGVTIPKSVTDVGDGAFSQCENLTAVTFLGTAPSIGWDAFSNVTANAYHCCTDATWTENVKNNYGGTLTWTGHIYEPVLTPPTCMQEGFTTYTCACGDSYTADPVPVTEHQFENNACTHCGQADPDNGASVVQPTLTLKAPTLEFRDMITVNAMFTAENTQDVVQMGMITYGEKVTGWSVETAEHVIPGTTYDVNTGRYIAHSQGIHAKYLGDDVYMAVYAKLADGTYAYSTELAPYSPADYARNQLENSSDVKLKQLCAAMLNYGSKAQQYFHYNAENPANAGMTAEQLALPESYRTDMVGAVPVASAQKQGSFVNTKGFAERYPAITFEGAFSITYFFTPTYAPVDGITLYYWTEADYNANDVLTVDNASGTVALEGSGTGQYRGDIKGISAKGLSEVVYVAAVYSDGTTTWASGVLGYSIGAYCTSLAAKGGAVSDLAMATAVYGYHAKQYFT